MVSVVNMRSLSKVISFASMLLVATPSLAQEARASEKGHAPVAGKAACDQGKALADARRYALAYLYMQRCHREHPTPAIRGVLYDVRSALRKEATSNATATLVGKTLPADYADNPLVDEDELWLPKGRYEIEVLAEGFQGGRFAVDVESVDRILIPISLQKNPEVGPREIDMSKERGAELGQVAKTVDPRPKEFETLLAKRYRRAPTPVPIPERPKTRGQGPWPYLAAGLGTVAIGSGVVLQTRSQSRPALASFVSGALLGGTAAYLFLRKSDEPPRQVALEVDTSGAMLLWNDAW